MEQVKYAVDSEDDLIDSRDEQEADEVLVEIITIEDEPQKLGKIFEEE